MESTIILNNYTNEYTIANYGKCYEKKVLSKHVTRTLTWPVQSQKFSLSDTEQEL